MFDAKTGDLVSWARSRWSPIRHVGILAVDGGEVVAVTTLPWPTEKHGPMTVDAVPLESLVAAGGMLRIHPLYRRMFDDEIVVLRETLIGFLNGDDSFLGVKAPTRVWGVTPSVALVWAAYRQVGLSILRCPRTAGQLIRGLRRATILDPARILS